MKTLTLPLTPREALDLERGLAIIAEIMSSKSATRFKRSLRFQSERKMNSITNNIIRQDIARQLATSNLYTLSGDSLVPQPGIVNLSLSISHWLHCRFAIKWLMFHKIMPSKTGNAVLQRLLALASYQS